MSLLSEARFLPRPALLRRVLRFADNEPTAWIEERRGAVRCTRAGCSIILGSTSPASTSPASTSPARAGHPGMRSRVPSYEGRAVCSYDCLGKLLEAEVRREFKQREQAADPYQHRMPLGLLMLSRKWITHEQLTQALSRQRREGYGRLGEWLVAAGASDEAAVARAVAAQWGIPALASAEQSSEAVRLLPRLFVEAFGIVPVRVAAARILYVAVDTQADAAVHLALEKMTGLRVEPVVVAASSFGQLRAGALAGEHPRMRIFQAATVPGLLKTMGAIVDEQAAANLRLCRLREYLWLQVERHPVPAKVPGGPRSRTRPHGGPRAASGDSRDSRGQDAQQLPGSEAELGSEGQHGAPSISRGSQIEDCIFICPDAGNRP